MTDTANAQQRDEVRNQFEDDSKVYRYAQHVDIRYGIPSAEDLLLNPFDMREAGQAVGVNMVAAQTCVLQALEDFGVNVPNTGSSTTQAWHNYCRANEIDYRTDSHYIRLYVGILHYRLKNNVVVPWNQIDWVSMGGDGRYLVSTYPHGLPPGNGTGHMIGVVINGGVVQTIHDRQQLTEPHLGGGGVVVRYIFRM
jgi:hypothetical protein